MGRGADQGHYVLQILENQLRFFWRGLPGIGANALSLAGFEAWVGKPPNELETAGSESRLEHDDFNRHQLIVPVAGESALLHHVDLHVICSAAKRGRCFTNVFAALCVTLRMQLVEVLFLLLRNI
jgi:hypothetical protein